MIGFPLTVATTASGSVRGAAAGRAGGCAYGEGADFGWTGAGAGGRAAATGGFSSAGAGVFAALSGDPPQPMSMRSGSAATVRGPENASRAIVSPRPEGA